jgi:hypothetical protein
MCVGLRWSRNPTYAANPTYRTIISGYFGGKNIVLVITYLLGDDQCGIHGTGINPVTGRSG